MNFKKTGQKNNRPVGENSPDLVTLVFISYTVIVSSFYAGAGRA
jgi:hypothetical protein